MGLGEFVYQAWGNTLSTLDESLCLIAAAGFSHAELGSEATAALVVGGRVNTPLLAELLAVVDRHRHHLSFTLHGPGYADLFDLANLALHDALLRSGLEIAAALGASIMVVHPGQRRPWPSGSALPMADLKRLEREYLWALAEESRTWGGAIALETWPPPDGQHEWGYSYAAWPEQLASQIEAIGHPAVGVCLDTAHLWESAQWYGFNFLSGARQLAPWVRHIHLVDAVNGAPSLAAVADISLGLGDPHLPPGWGRIPFAELFDGVEFPHQPVLMAEVIHERYRPYLEPLRVQLENWTAVRRGLETS